MSTQSLGNSVRLLENSRAQGTIQGNENVATASVLTDNVLLEIFDFCRGPESNDIDCTRGWQRKWKSLAQVCRKWRQIIYASPCRLNLQLFCTGGTPVRKYLGIWPVIPIQVEYGARPGDEDNIIAALEHPDRVCRVGLSVTGAQLEKMSAVIQKPFPVLTHLSVSSECENGLLLPNGFLGGFAPCLQELDLADIAFPSLPTFLSSARNLVKLTLWNIPRTCYISPDEMVAHLAVLPKLKTFDIGFNSHSDPTPLRPITRSVLPSLQSLSFTGDYKYLEDFVSRVDTPQLDTIDIDYWDQYVDFVVPQLASFINRSESLKQILSGHCQIMVDHNDVVDLNIGDSPETEQWERKIGISVCIQCEWVDRQISHLSDILGCISPILSDVVHLTIDSFYFVPESRRMSELWLLLLRRFSSVQTLFVSDNVAVPISQALEYVDVDEEMITGVLPALELFCLAGDEEGEGEEGRPMPSFHRFINLRQDYGRPVTIVETKAEFEERLKSYR